MNRYKVSIITVCYNASAVIEETIRSVIAQTYINIEYIIIDGGSVDKTSNIISKYNNHIDIFVSEPDKGIFDAMNKGVKIANGDWVIFMNAGDAFASNNVLYEVFVDEYPKDVGVVFGDAYFKRLNSKVLYESQPFYENPRKFKHMGICHQSIFVRAALAKMYPFDLAYRYAADYNMVYALYRSGFKFVKTKVIVAEYDTSGVSSVNVLPQFKEVAKICGVNPLCLEYKKYYLYALFRAFIAFIKKKFI